MTSAKKIDFKSIKYINLHAHDMFSLLDGVMHPKEHIKEAAEKGHCGFCITNHGNGASLLHVYNLTRDQKFKKETLKNPEFAGLLGCEIYLSKDLSQRDPNDKYNHITLIAKNETGYKNLCYLISIASLPDHVYYKPRISIQELIDHKEGLIATTGCFLGVIPKAIHKGTGEEEMYFKLFKDAFGDDFYVELHLSDISYNFEKDSKTFIKSDVNPQVKVNKRLIELADQYNVKVYITQDSHMPKKEHHKFQDILIANSPSGKSGWRFPEAYYIMSVEEMYNRMKECHDYISDDKFVEYCQNSIEALNKCKDLTIGTRPILPQIVHSEHAVNSGIDDYVGYLELKNSLMGDQTDPNPSQATLSATEETSAKILEIEKEAKLRADKHETALNEFITRFKGTSKDMDFIIGKIPTDMSLSTTLKIIIGNG
jgi:DNA polymerase III alpha subunit